MSTKLNTFEQLKLLGLRCASYTAAKILELTNAVNDTLEEFDVQKADKATVFSLPLSENWTSNSDGTFTQVITVENSTEKSKIDLQPDSTTINQLLSDGVAALYIANNGGTLTAYAIEGAPTVALTIQATLTEVE